MIGREYYVCGGYSGSVYLDSCEVYSFSKNEWNLLPLRMPDGFHSAAAVPFEHFLYVLGGFNGSSFLKSMYRYDTHLKEWSTMASMTTSRTNAGAAVIIQKNGRWVVVACGGASDEVVHAQSDCESYDIVNDAWSEFPEMLVERSGLGFLIEWKGKLYTLGTRDLFRTSEVFDGETGEWSMMEIMPKIGRIRFATVIF